MTACISRQRRIECGAMRWPALRLRSSRSKCGCYLGGKVPFGYRVSDDGALVEHEAEQDAIRTMRVMRNEGKALRAIATAMADYGIKISHEGVSKVLATF